MTRDDKVVEFPNTMTLRRIALTTKQLTGLPSFPARDKRKDPRYKWFVANCGTRCWELDAMDPRDLRACVKKEIKIDRACGVATLRDRQPGGAGIAANDPRKLGQAVRTGELARR